MVVNTVTKKVRGCLVGVVTMIGSCYATNSPVESKDSDISLISRIGQYESVTMHPYEIAAKKVFDECSCSLNDTALNTDFIKLLKNISFGSFDCNSPYKLTEYINFRENLFSLSFATLIKKNAFLKASLVCFALNGTSSLGMETFKEFKIEEKLDWNKLKNSITENNLVDQVALEKLPKQLVI